MRILSIYNVGADRKDYISIKKILTLIAVWRERSRMRHQLNQLPNYRLEDMGISPADALLESEKPFWEK